MPNKRLVVRQRLEMTNDSAQFLDSSCKEVLLDATYYIGYEDGLKALVKKLVASNSQIQAIFLEGVTDELIEEIKNSFENKDLLVAPMHVPTKPLAANSFDKVFVREILQEFVDKAFNTTVSKKFADVVNEYVEQYVGCFINFAKGACAPSLAVETYVKKQILIAASAMDDEAEKTPPWSPSDFTDIDQLTPRVTPGAIKKPPLKRSQQPVFAATEPDAPTSGAIKRPRPPLKRTGSCYPTLWGLNSGRANQNKQGDQDKPDNGGQLVSEAPSQLTY